MTWVSYAQNYEDVVLARVLADVPVGAYIDVGAQDPRMDSVTCAFYERGWRGINIEPVAHWHALLAQARPADVNVGVAAGAGEGRLHFFEVADSGLSTASAEFAARHRAAGFSLHEREVRVRTLDAICADARLREAHFLKIDVEGAEADVLRGISLQRLRPWVVLVEATEPNSRVSRHDQWEALLLDRGYGFAYGDGINRYYLADEHAALASRFGPPTVLDDFVRREQVDLAAEIEGRLAAVDALSQRRAAEILALVARIDDKDAELADWHGRWTAQAEAAGRLRGELGHAAGREQALQVQAAEAARRAADLGNELDRMHREAAALQAALAESGARERARAAEIGAQAAMLATQAATLGTQAALLDTQAAKLDTQSAKLDTQAAKLDTQSALLDTQSAMLDTQSVELQVRALRIAQLERDLAVLARRVPDLEASLRASTDAHAAAHGELLRHVGLIDGLRGEQARILASRSWRLTAPLRGANALLAGVVARASGLARALARRPFARTAAALALRPFPGLAARVKRRLYGPPPAADATPSLPPLPLSEDAERILALAPVVEPTDARGAD